MAAQDSLLKKHSITIAGHRTSLTLENIFWEQLKYMARARGVGLGQLITEIDHSRRGNLSSAIRVYILKNALS